MIKAESHFSLVARPSFDDLQNCINGSSFVLMGGKKHRQEIKTFRRLSKAAKVVKMDWHESPSCCSLTKKTSLCCQRFGFCCLFWDWELVSVVTYKCDKATFKLVVSIRRVTLFLHSVARYGNSTFTTLLLPCVTPEHEWSTANLVGPNTVKQGVFKSPLP